MSDGRSDPLKKTFYAEAHPQDSLLDFFAAWPELEIPERDKTDSD
jgi:hypothetical protein